MSEKDIDSKVDVDSIEDDAYDQVSAELDKIHGRAPRTGSSQLKLDKPSENKKSPVIIYLLICVAIGFALRWGIGSLENTGLKEPLRVNYPNDAAISESTPPTKKVRSERILKERTEPKRAVSNDEVRSDFDIALERALDSDPSFRVKWKNYKREWNLAQGMRLQAPRRPKIPGYGPDGPPPIGEHIPANRLDDPSNPYPFGEPLF